LATTLIFDGLFFVNYDFTDKGQPTIPIVYSPIPPDID